jgi:hypothetical protein
VPISGVGDQVTRSGSLRADERRDRGWERGRGSPRDQTVGELFAWAKDAKWHKCACVTREYASTRVRAPSGGGVGARELGSRQRLELADDRRHTHTRALTHTFTGASRIVGQLAKVASEINGAPIIPESRGKIKRATPSTPSSLGFTCRHIRAHAHLHADTRTDYGSEGCDQGVSSERSVDAVSVSVTVTVIVSVSL